MDVNAIDLSGADPAGRGDLERMAADNLKRVLVLEEDWAAEATMRRMQAFVEIKTVWHPAGT
jgi:aldehyde dehydrogenase (NAD+)